MRRSWLNRLTALAAMLWLAMLIAIAAALIG
jgi:preprotein translocase subunit SecG